MYNKKSHINNIKIVLLTLLLWFVAVQLYFNIVIQTLLLSDKLQIELSNYYFVAIIVGVLLGFLAGVIELFYQVKQFKRFPFFLIVISKTILLFIAFLCTVYIIVLIDPQDRIVHLSFLDRSNHFIETIFHREFLNHLFYTFVFGFMINLFVQVNKKMGKGVLLNLVLGKYHKPRKEERIFGFLDLSSSSLIAEKLSPELYSALLKDFFLDIDVTIEDTRGTIFQYVGDEVVIIWKKEEGICDNNCIRFFFLAQKIIENRKAYYIEKYNVMPEFKAGIHFGEVVVTEVGGVKREIAYHGDIINTTSRIRSACTELKEQLLISADLLSLLTHIDFDFKVVSKGVTSLKGKTNVIGIFSISEK